MFKQFVIEARKDAHTELRVQAKGFVKKVVLMTPPASQDATGRDAKKQGEQAIRNDLARIMKPVTVKKGSNLESPEAIYRRLRDPRTGRINPRGLKKPYPVAAAAFRALLAKLLANVGILAAGWNAAAQALGVSVPAWIKRHGTGHGSIRVQTGATGMKITVSNKVRYAESVKGLERRMQKALDYQTSAMQRQMAALVEKAAKRARVDKA